MWRKGDTHRKGDAGFSLSEMLIVMAIMGFVIGGAYSLSLITQRASQTTEIRSAFTREIGAALQITEKYLQQNSALEEWGDYRLVCFTDTDMDGLAERVTIQAFSDGRLELTIWNTDLNRDNTTKRIDVELSTHNTNVADGTPLFTYLDDDSIEVASYDARASDTINIEMHIVAEVEDQSISDSRVVHFRNRD